MQQLLMFCFCLVVTMNSCYIARAAMYFQICIPQKKYDHTTLVQHDNIFLFFPEGCTAAKNLSGPTEPRASNDIRI